MLVQLYFCIVLYFLLRLSGMLRLVLSVANRVFWWLTPEVHGGCGSFVLLHCVFMRLWCLSGCTDEVEGTFAYAPYLLCFMLLLLVFFLGRLAPDFEVEGAISMFVLLLPVATFCDFLCFVKVFCQDVPKKWKVHSHMLHVCCVSCCTSRFMSTFNQGDANWIRMQRRGWWYQRSGAHIIQQCSFYLFCFSCLCDCSSRWLVAQRPQLPVGVGGLLLTMYGGVCFLLTVFETCVSKFTVFQLA